MNKNELRAMILTGCIMIVFLFSLLYNAWSRKINVPTCVRYDKVFENPQVKQVDDSTYEAYVVAQMWRFAFSADGKEEIDIPAGSTVTFYLTTKDVVHGFNIDRKGINLMAIPGAVNTATVKFDQPGVYNILCHEYCGIGHQNMLGKVVVTNQN